MTVGSEESAGREPLEDVKKQERGRGDKCQGENSIKGLEANRAKGHLGEFNRAERTNNAIYQDELQEKQREGVKLTESCKPAEGKRTVAGCADERAADLEDRENGEESHR